MIEVPVLNRPTYIKPGMTIRLAGPAKAKVHWPDNKALNQRSGADYLVDGRVLDKSGKPGPLTTFSFRERDWKAITEWMKIAHDQGFDVRDYESWRVVFVDQTGPMVLTI